MASSESQTPDPNEVSASHYKLPEVKCEVTADEEKFECPQPWYLALLTVAMSAMTSITVAGSLFFLLAAPEKVSPHCYEHKHIVTRGFCTASVIAFWTYPVVCCLFVVLVYCKNMIDQRTYYEFLLHKVVMGYPRSVPYEQPVVIALLVYALLAFSALVWYHCSQTTVLAGHVYCSLAYITPIVSFLAVIFAQWSIQGKLITLPNFLEDYGWAVKHLNDSRCYTLEELHAGYLILENELDKSDEVLDTPKAVALLEHYATVVRATPRVAGTAADEEQGAAGKAVTAKVLSKEELVELEAKRAQRMLVNTVEEAREWIYWEIRLLFNPRLQDERSQSFRNWALAYMVGVIFAIIISVYIFIACLVTCLEIEHMIDPGGTVWSYTHYFSLRPDLASGHSSLKAVMSKVAMSGLQTSARSYMSRSPPGGLLQFRLGAAAL